MELLAKGASPAAACQHLGVPVSAFLHSLADDPAFREALADVNEILTRNVVAALYQAAMKGSIPAQTLWLRNTRPREWSEQHEDGRNQSISLDELELTDEQVLALARAMGVPVPPELG